MVSTRKVMAVRFEVLGPVQIVYDGAVVGPISPMRRLLLAVLLTRANRSVETDVLTEALWPQQLPARRGNNLSLHIHRLRQVLDRPDRITSTGSGYRISLGGDDLDSAVFDTLHEQARMLCSDGKVATAAQRFRDALTLWRGAPYADVDDAQIVAPEARRLAEARAIAHEELYDLELALGRAREIVPELTEIVAGYPLRERFTGQLMVALYRSGRRARALAAYRALRRRLGSELGAEPGRDVRELFDAIAAEDDRLRHPGGDSSVAVTTTTDYRKALAPSQLPPSSGAFTGRTAELAKLDALATANDSPGLVLLTGMAGVGKTELALQFARRSADRFDDGQLYVDLRGHAQGPPLEPAEALARLLSGVGADTVPGTMEDAAGEFRSRLAGRKMLILLDNAASAAQVRPLITATAGCLTLVTSRSKLSGLVARNGVPRVELSVLPEGEAMGLLMQALGDERVRREPDAATALVAQCAGLPLALRIVAAQLFDQPFRSLADHVAELRTVGIAALRLDEDELSAVGSVFGVSYLRLADRPRRMFRLLGLIPGADFTPAAAAAVAGCSTAEAQAMLRRLVHVHLVEAHDVDRYRMHDLLRGYARERASHEESAQERREALERLFAWYYHCKEAVATQLQSPRRRPPRPEVPQPEPAVVFADQRSAACWLRCEFANLSAATRVTADLADFRQWTWHLVLGVLVPATRWGFMVEATAAAQRALTAARAASDRHAIAYAATEAAAVGIIAATPVPDEFHGEVIEHARSADDRFIEGYALYVAGVVRNRQRAAAAGEGLLTRALSVQRADGDHASQAMTLNYLGATALTRGDLRDAARRWEEILLLDRSPATTSACINLSLTLPFLGRLTEIDQLMKRAESLIESEDNRPAACVLMMSRAQWSRYCQMPADAVELALGAHRLAAELGIPRLNVDAGDELGQCHLARADVVAAAEVFGPALTIAKAAGLHDGCARTLRGLAEAKLAAGQPAAAKHLAEEALCFAGGERRLLAADANLTLARIELALGNADSATVIGRRALAAERKVGHVLGEAGALQLLADAYRAHHDPAQNALAAAYATQARHIVETFRRGLDPICDPDGGRLADSASYSRSSGTSP